MRAAPAASIAAACALLPRQESIAPARRPRPSAQTSAAIYVRLSAKSPPFRPAAARPQLPQSRDANAQRTLHQPVAVAKETTSRTISANQGQKAPPHWKSPTLPPQTIGRSKAARIARNDTLQDDKQR